MRAEAPDPKPTSSGCAQPSLLQCERGRALRQMQSTRCALLGVDVAQADRGAEADSCSEALSLGSSSCWSDYEPQHEPDALSDVDSADGREGERPQRPPCLAPLGAARPPGVTPHPL